MITGQDFDSVLTEIKKIKSKYPNFGGVFNWEYFNSPPKGTLDPSEWSKIIYNLYN